MRTRRVMMLAAPALLGALAFGPAAASPATASAGTAKAAVVQAGITVNTVAVAPPGKKRYNKGYSKGFSDGRFDCKGGQPFDLNFTGSDPFSMGYRNGYISGFHSCTPPKKP
ncbi:hypothetical protein MTP10_39015 [Nonomuraea sp. 3-1Str]|uniref:hypothetical protein n=1 Tax=Nonomuraea sp. 3-1Str TaxID=2929801 RepID=UPI002866EA60|nr:hypothetical protein [Nonomuraea sp. 3-1Str]MDR8414705.1 hypothetical protein [Nonomuraea sp. 3-1Str]